MHSRLPLEQTARLPSQSGPLDGYPLPSDYQEHARVGRQGGIWSQEEYKEGLSTVLE